MGEISEDIVRTVDVLSYLDLIRAKALYADDTKGMQPALLPFREREDTPEHPGSIIQIEQARHPLIPGKVVPIDVDFGRDTWSLVITGPNTGGKTVALKTVGLLALMSQCGLPIPCVQATLTVFEGVYADIGDEQSIEQSLSTFSSHMTNTIDILEACDDHSLVLLDEVGAGTDPAEGSALARAILNHLVAQRATTMVTTHHPELKNYAVETDGVRNASVEFDVETLSPTYRLIIGLPGRSNALSIATRLGLDESIIQDAREMVSSAELDADKMLDEIHRSREEIRQREREIAAIQEDMDADRAALRERLDNVRGRTARRAGEGAAQGRGRSQRAAARNQAAARRNALGLVAAGKPARHPGYGRPAHGAVPEAARNRSGGRPGGGRQRLDAARGRHGLPGHAQERGAGRRTGEEEAVVQVGALKVRAGLEDVRRPNRTDRKIAKKEESRRRREREYRDTRPDVASPGLELDLRGQRVEEALRNLDEYLDAAYLSGLPYTRIIHGKGTGALRRAVREKAEGHPLVSKVVSARPNEGGEGVTVIHMVPLN